MAPKLYLTNILHVSELFLLYNVNNVYGMENSIYDVVTALKFKPVSKFSFLLLPSKSKNISHKFIYIYIFGFLVIALYLSYFLSFVTIIFFYCLGNFVKKSGCSLPDQLYVTWQWGMDSEIQRHLRIITPSKREYMSRAVGYTKEMKMFGRIKIW